MIYIYLYIYRVRFVYTYTHVQISKPNCRRLCSTRVRPRSSKVRTSPRAHEVYAFSRGRDTKEPAPKTQT